MLVLVVSLGLHVRTMPYAYRHQNVGDAVLSSLAILALLGSNAYYAAKMPLDLFASFAIVGLLLGPVPILIVVAAKLRRVRAKQLTLIRSGVPSASLPSSGTQASQPMSQPLLAVRLP